MQIKKDHVREQIAAAAKEVFLRKGFVKTSMRNIADDAGVSVSNLYNYFENKDDLFRFIVTPLTGRLERIVREHHSVRHQEDFMRYASGQCGDMMTQNMQVYLELLSDYRDELRLLLFKAQGSSLENYIDFYTDECTRQVVDFMEAFSRRYTQFSRVNTPFTYHIHTVWMFSFISEMVKHQLSPSEMEKAIADYMQFEYVGWRNIMNQ